MAVIRRSQGVHKISDTALQVLKGKDGIDGKNGIDGRNGIDGKDGKDGVDGRNGLDGKNGRDGKDGITTTIVKEVVLDISDIRDRLDKVDDDIAALRKQGATQANTQNYFPGGGNSDDIVYTSGNCSVGINNAIVLFSASGTCKLPPKPREDQRVTVKQGSNAVAITIDGNGKNIDGAATFTIATSTGQTMFTGIDLIYLRGQWYII